MDSPDQTHPVDEPEFVDDQYDGNTLEQYVIPFEME